MSGSALLGLLVWIALLALGISPIAALGLIMLSGVLALAGHAWYMRVDGPYDREHTTEKGRMERRKLKSTH